MKKQFLYTLALLFFTVGLIKAQTIPGSHTRNSCNACVPTGWSVSGWTSSGHQHGHTVSWSGVYGGAIDDPDPNVLYYFGFRPNLPKAPSGHTYFMTVDNHTGASASSSTSITNLIPGHSYTVKYNISTAKVTWNFKWNADPEKITYDISGYAKTAKVTVSDGVGTLAIQSHIFNPGVDTDIWLQKSITFKATATTAMFTLSGMGDNSSPGVVAFDLEGIQATCSATSTQIVLKSSNINPCFGSSVDLTDISLLSTVPTGNPSSMPFGFEFKVYDNPNRTGNPVTTTTKNGTFYYFFYDKVADCYNTNTSTAKLTVTFREEQQVLLGFSNINNKCAGTTADLNSAVESAPNSFQVVWSKSPQHFGSDIINPESVGAGTYYAFFKDPASGCYLTNNSTAKVIVSIPNELQVPLNGNLITNWCPSAVSNLNTMLNGSAPLGFKLHWFTNADHQGTLVEDPTTVGKGTYYAFYYDVLNKCYKTVHSTSYVIVNNIPEFQVPLSASNAVNSCPSKVIDLTKLVKGSAPSGYKVVWYTNNTHTGTAIADPTAVTKAGTYYAFYFNESNSCFGSEVSAAKVDAKIGRCEFVANPITLNTKVFLQGAMDGIAMHNHLQTYFPDGTGLLPVSDPYDGSSTYDDIYNMQGVAGSIVDWVRVEVRSSVDPAIILEAQSLLLRTDGRIVNTEGLDPIFQSQATPVRLVVKHRNHLPVMSNALNFSGTSASYDFTTDLSQASNEFSDPNQMLQVNGVWCMIAGDVQQDLSVDNVDLSLFYISFNQGDLDVYSAQDLNLDGIVDNLDIYYFDNSFNAGYFSTIINY